MTTQITITWNSTRCASASASFELNLKSNATDEQVMNVLYEVTNLQSELAEFGASESKIELWNKIEKILPANRSHTSLSIGDEIKIAGRAYLIAETGFLSVETIGA